MMKWYIRLTKEQFEREVQQVRILEKKDDDEKKMMEKKRIEILHQVKEEMDQIRNDIQKNMEDN